MVIGYHKVHSGKMGVTWLMLLGRQQQHLSVCTSLGRYYPSKITLDSGNRMNEKNNMEKEVKNKIQHYKKGKR